jgi:hypothetical protein
METQTNTTIKKILLVLYIVVLAFFAWQIMHAMSIRRSTGVLQVTTSSPNAQISVSQVDSQATSVGTGSTTVRLQPGSYQVVAVDGGKRASAVVAIHRDSTTNSSLKLNAAGTSSSGGPTIHTVQDINFQNMDVLIDQEGLSTEQESELEQYFFQFKPSANTINLNTNTITQGQHNPNVASPFSLNFYVTIDGANYFAAVSYLGPNNVKLQVFNPQSGKRVFVVGSDSSV